MMMRCFPHGWRGLGALLAALIFAQTAQGDEPAPRDREASKEEAKTETPPAKPKYPPFDEFFKEAKHFDQGMIKLHQKDNKLYGELSSSQLDRDFIVVISIARGIGEGDLLGGMSWGFGNDWLWQFRREGDDIHIVRRNVRFTATEKSPAERAVKLAYTDSVLFSLPIATTSPSGGIVIDLTPIFMSDLPQISRSLPGFAFASNKSTWAELKSLPQNVEIEVAATYASSGIRELDTVPDSRGATINVHYSISQLPQNGFKPRLADDRIGYFLTAVKDFSKKGQEDRFVRYINRWDLQKAEPSATLSPPKDQIVFWLEKTIPFDLRKPIREGIEEWNKAFEKAGFANAIEVRQQPDDADWDPEDINYNTFRWITASAGFAMGPSRVNPLTGQILDADIIFDADFIQFWKQEYETFTPATIAAMTGGPLNLDEYRAEMARVPEHLHHHYLCQCDFRHGFSRELAFGSAVLSVRETPSKDADEKLIMQGLKEITMHEVGHTLGLRHNFKASTWRSLQEINDKQKSGDNGLVGSVMDYTPTNLMPKGVPQGDYYTSTIGPYDYWAIEYGYKPLSAGSPDGELPELRKIAAKCAEAGLDYATDEDTRGIDSDPLANRFDLGDDSLEYAKARAKLVNELWPELVSRIVKEGEGYQKARRAFGTLLGNYGRAMFFAAREVGGVYVHRDHMGDPKARTPFVVVPAEKQRDALSLLEEQVFNDKPFNFPPELYNHMAASRWLHWGTPPAERVDYAVHEVISMWQDRVLQQLLSSLTLTRLHDTELKVPADQDAMTTAELLDRLTNSIFSEVDGSMDGEFTNRKPAVSSLRRNLQRTYLRRLSNLALGGSRTGMVVLLSSGQANVNFTSAPQDCQTIAYVELEELEGRIKAVLDGSAKLDAYSRAHLIESAARIRKVLDARLSLATP